jgi:hypothetical protein
MLRKLMGLLVCIMVVSAATAAVADVPSPDSPAVFLNGDPGVQVTVYNLPNANGAPFTEAYDIGGTQHDATIQLTVLNLDLNPIPNFAAEDCWLMPTDDNGDGSFFPCFNGTIADANTDGSGNTQWQNALGAGGYTDPSVDVTQVYISGTAINGPGFDVQFNSADVNSDGDVNLSDVGDFATDYFGAYNFRSDFVWDGDLNLSDVGNLATGFGAECP